MTCRARAASLQAGRGLVALLALATASGLPAVTPGLLAQSSPATPAEAAVPGWLGLTLQVQAVPEETPGAVDGVRLFVTDLYGGGPADRGGLRPGDVIVRLNGSPAAYSTFRSVVTRLRAGDPLALTVLRSGRMVDLALKASAGPDRADVRRLGVQVRLDSVRVAFMQRLDSLRTRMRSADSMTVFASAPQVHVQRVDGDSITTVVVLRQPDGSVVRLPDGWAGGTITLRYWSGMTADSEALPPLGGVLQRANAPNRPQSRDDPSVEASASATWRPLTPYLAGANRVAGAELAPIAPGMGTYFGVDAGLLVVEVVEGTPARSAGLQPGDVIRAAAGQPVASVGAFRGILAQNGPPLTLQVVRRGQPVELVLPR